MYAFDEILKSSVLMLYVVFTHIEFKYRIVSFYLHIATYRDWKSCFTNVCVCVFVSMCTMG